MITVKKLIVELQKFPTDAKCYGYYECAGVTGVIIKSSDGKSELSYIETQSSEYVRQEEAK